MRAFWISVLCASTAAAEPLPTEFRRVGPTPLDLPHVAEASGVASASTPGFLWIINDSGGTADIHLIGIDGKSRGKLRLKGVENHDWEALASFSLQGKNHLLVADTGDNQARRETSAIHIVAEPTLPNPGDTLDAVSPPSWQIHFRHQGGPRDCEAVAVDAKAGKILLITKRTQPPEVHELPLRPPAESGVLTTRKIGFTSVKPPVATLIPFSNQPTGLDLSADGSLAAILTYHGVFLFPRNPGESWADALARKGTALDSHRLIQAEAITFSENRSKIHVLSEGCKSPLVTYQPGK